eukprot:gene10588-biopygen256
MRVRARACVRACGLGGHEFAGLWVRSFPYLSSFAEPGKSRAAHFVRPRSARTPGERRGSLPNRGKKINGYERRVAAKRPGMQEMLQMTAKVQQECQPGPRRPLGETATPTSGPRPFFCFCILSCGQRPARVRSASAFVYPCLT